MEVTLEREQLYREVWSKSVKAVARKYDVTEGDIRKACFALEVPRPAHGYWAKVKAGSAPPAPSLSRRSGGFTYTCRAISRPSKGPTEMSRSKSTVAQTKPKESIVDWVLKNRADLQSRGPAQTPPPPRNSMHLLPEDTIGLPRYIPIEAWAELLLGEHAPHRNTLMRWVHEGFIQPQPVKIGRRWCVRKDAAYIPD